MHRNATYFKKFQSKTKLIPTVKQFCDLDTLGIKVNMKYNCFLK